MEAPLLPSLTPTYLRHDPLDLARDRYGSTLGCRGFPLSEYFPVSWRQRIAQTPIHHDPEFETFTYGDPTPPKAGLRCLAKGDLLVFYCGLQGWDFESLPALYLMGHFEVAKAGLAPDLGAEEILSDFGRNYHVRHRDALSDQWPRLVLVKGGPGSRLYGKATKISSTGRDRAGRPLKVLSAEMREVFGELGGRASLQRSPTRWVEPAFVEQVAAFVRSLA